MSDVKKRRQDAALTRRDLADRTNLSVATIVHAERCPDRVSSAARLKIEHAIVQRERQIAGGKVAP
jgi:DNA-binding XRE family transcriptional regulator